MSFAGRLSRRALLVAALLLAAGCASVKPPDSGARAPSFDLLGRMLASYSGKAFSASLRWAHGANSDELWLMTPTGQALAHIREDAEGATFTGMDQVRYRAASVEDLTKQALGWALPLTRLQHWVRGAPAPGVAASIAESDASGRITQMTQDGWHISYEYYAATQHDGLPRRMELVSKAQTIRLVIDTWRSDAPGSSDIRPITR